MKKLKITKKPKILIEAETLLPFWLLGSAVITSILHNFIYAIFQVEEAMLMLITLLLVLGFIISIIYNVLLYINQGKPTDIWKMGWLGVLGSLCLFAPALVVFYGFFAFFGLKKK